MTMSPDTTTLPAVAPQVTGSDDEERAMPAR